MSEWRSKRDDILQTVKYSRDDESLNNALSECRQQYQEYLKSNDKALSYNLYDFMILNQTKRERDKLSVIFDELENQELVEMDLGIIGIVAMYSAAIYARATASGSVHFSYGGILPSKHVHENVNFRKENAEDVPDFTDSDKPIYGEVRHVFEREHPDPTVITEGTYSRSDVLIYYAEHDVYCITQNTDSVDHIEFLDFELHRDFEMPSNDNEKQ